MQRRGGVDARLARRGRDGVAPAPEGGALLGRAGGAVHGEGEFLGLEVAARPEVGEGLAEELGPVFQAEAEHARVDEVEARGGGGGGGGAGLTGGAAFFGLGG